MPKAGDSIGPYTLISKLGRGAFGVVWLAEKRSVLATTKFALKLPNDEDVDLEAVKQEAAIWVHASGHPNVLPIIDADVYGEHVVIASEYAPDGSLSKWLEARGDKAEKVKSATEMALGILAGLEHLHHRGIIHRDLKPDNILLQNVTPRLADFGIARILKTTSKSTIATGTPAYMPPEAFDGKRNEQTDLWSVGVILYQMLTGRLPFEQSDMASLLAAIITKEPAQLPSTIPAGICAVVEKALTKNPSARWQTASEMRAALQAAMGETHLSADTSQPHSSPPKTLPADQWRATPKTTIAAGLDIPLGDSPGMKTLTALPLAAPHSEGSRVEAMSRPSIIGSKRMPLIVVTLIAILASTAILLWVSASRTRADLSSPRATLRTQYEATVKNDYTTFKRTWAKAAIDRFTQTAQSSGKSLDEYFRPIFEAQRKSIEPVMWEVQSEELSGDSAWLTITTKSGPQRVKFNKEDGVWEIVGFWGQ
jgi:serine/threonine protein kinase